MVYKVVVGGLELEGDLVILFIYFLLFSKDNKVNCLLKWSSTKVFSCVYVVLARYYIKNWKDYVEFVNL